MTGSSDKTVRMWDIQTGECVYVLLGHKGPVHTLAMSPDGRFCASAGQDTSILLWDLATGNLLRTLSGHEGIVWSLDFSCEGAALVSGSNDESVCVWCVLQLLSICLAPTTASPCNAPSIFLMPFSLGGVPFMFHHSLFLLLVCMTVLVVKVGVRLLFISRPVHSSPVILCVCVCPSVVGDAWVHGCTPPAVTHPPTLM